MTSSVCLQGALPAAGIVEPTPVQLEAIPHILRGVDVAVQSYTGSGKVRLDKMRASLLPHRCADLCTSQAGRTTIRWQHAGMRAGLLSSRVCAKCSSVYQCPEASGSIWRLQTTVGRT